jgi:hypothetical protein
MKSSPNNRWRSWWKSDDHEVIWIITSGIKEKFKRRKRLLNSHQTIDEEVDQRVDDDHEVI